jgi:putative peptide modification system cyclase
MNLSVSPPPRSAAGSPVTPVLRAVLLADLADSTAFVQRFGDARAAAALQRLDLQIRDLLSFTGGQLIDKADGLLALFERPVQAVDFALRYQQALRQFSVDEGAPLAARIGIHVGELMTWSNTDADVKAGAKPLEVEGLAKPVAARLMALALPGQILVSSMAQSLAQRAQAELGERAERVKWVSHGRYRFKGVPAPVLVHEVGEVGASPLKQPPSGQKVWRELPLWRRPPVLAAELAVILAVVGFYSYSLFQSPPALAFQQRDWVVVGDLNNFTGDTRLDDSLDTALRISLEQSRYVNVVPELKVRSVLKRMGRPGDAAVDRAVGSEIALREGARALLLTSVAEVGGKLRVSLELVDPASQVTVYADSQEGRGIESALVSLDSLNGRLRERLGESLADIDQSGKPLAQITTPSLEALRLYTLANEAAIQHYKFDESLRLLNLALREDPEFAMAYSSRARLRLADSDYPKARQDYALAARFRDRLSTREALMLDTGLAEFGPAQARIDIWKTVARLYPDTYRAHFQVAYNESFYLQAYSQALTDLKPALTSQNPRLSGALHLSGVINLGLEQYSAAISAFQRAESLGSRDPRRYHADAFAISRQHDRASQLLKGQAKTGFAGADMDARLPEVTYPLDRGEWSRALAAAHALAEEASASAPLSSRTYRGSWLGLRSYEDSRRVLPELRDYTQSELTRALLPDDPEVVSSSFAALYGAILLARGGDVAAAEDAFTKLRPKVPELGYPALDDLLAILSAELALNRKDTTAALAMLRARLTGGELNWVHAALLRALRQAGAVADARREAEWLASHRGRAYVEWNSQYLLQPLNVLESNLALLTSAEIARDGGDATLAAAELQRFEAAWPDPPGFVAGRTASVRDWLSQHKNRTGQKSPR